MIRRPIAPLVALFLAGSVALSSGCGKNPAEPSTTPTSEVVAFGDSLTYGSGTTGGNDYVSVLSRRVGVTIYNAGVPGSTTERALSRLDTSVLARDPRIVIVLLGGNDLLDGVPVQTRINNITTIVQRIRGTGAGVLLVGIGSPPIDPFNGTLPALASSTGSTYVPDVLDGIFGVPSLMADAVHPNNAGHAIIADRLEPPLRAALAAIPQ
jgi:lysophospholipase L1-like esterase